MSIANVRFYKNIRNWKVSNHDFYLGDFWIQLLRSGPKTAWDLGPGPRHIEGCYLIINLNNTHLNNIKELL